MSKLFWLFVIPLIVAIMGGVAVDIAIRYLGRVESKTSSAEQAQQPPATIEIVARVERSVPPRWHPEGSVTTTPASSVKYWRFTITPERQIKRAQVYEK